jgi:hypothetical protein
MKKLLTGIFVVIFYTYHVSCNKSNSARPGQPNLNPVTVEVVEYKTNKPIEGAQFSLFTHVMFHPDAELETKFTDTNGRCQVYEGNLQPMNQIYITKPSYRVFDTWDHSTPDSANPRRFTLDKIGLLKINMIDSTGYSGRGSIDITYRGERLNSSIGTANFLMNLTDISFTYTVYGNQTNTISVNILDSNYNVFESLGPYTLFVPNTGMSELEIKY